jgi:hypothetical protein
VVDLEGTMGDLPWLDGYGGQTTDALLAMDGTYRTDSLVLAFEQGVEGRSERVGPDALTWPERVILAVEALEREVNSGGFDAWLRYASEYVPLTAAALVDIGRSDVAAMVDSAIASLALPGDIAAGAVVAAMERDDDLRSARLAALDTAYFKDAGDLAEPLLAFIRSRRDDIMLP